MCFPTPLCSLTLDGAVLQSRGWFYTIASLRCTIGSFFILTKCKRKADSVSRNITHFTKQYAYYSMTYETHNICYQLSSIKDTKIIQKLHSDL